MSEENDKGASIGSRRFRLPKLFAESDETEENESQEDDLAENYGGSTTYPTSSVTSPSGSVASAPHETVAPVASTPSAPTAGPSDIESDSGVMLEYLASMAQELLALRGTLEQVNDRVDEINARESSQEKVFDTLHSELRDYKNDFIYEHLKPVVRPLLFLYDSLEQFDGEIAVHERPEGDERRGISPRLVRENITFFRDQLVEALRVCEVTQMDTPQGEFNAKLQKAIGVVPVDATQNNIIQRVVRSGWYLNGQLLRPAEVVIGKAK